MSCCEHFCRDCHYSWFNNNPNSLCPQCGSDNVSHFFDQSDDIHPMDEVDEDNTFGAV